MSIRSIWPPRIAAPVKGVARFKARCECGSNEWCAVDFGNVFGWKCLPCGSVDADHPRVTLPERDRTEEDL